VGVRLGLCPLRDWAFAPYGIGLEHFANGDGETMLMEPLGTG